MTKIDSEQPGKRADDPPEQGVQGRFNLVLIALGILFGFVVGCSAGFLLDGNWTAPWVAAAGAWVGAVGTISAIVWAVHSFQVQRGWEESKAQAELQDRANREANAARQVIVTCSSGGGVSGKMTSVQFGVTNGSSTPLILHGFEMDGVDVPSGKSMSVAIPASEGWARRFNVTPFEATQAEIENARPISRACTFRYSIDGVHWARRVGGDPVRQ